MRSVAALLFILFSNLVTLANSDTTSHVLTLPEFLETVRNYHPVAKQASLIIENAKAELRAARGNFDPTITASFDKKKFSGEQYYQYWNPEIRVPTWYGIEVYTGLEEIYGTRVNPENTIGQTSYAGISVPLLRNLVIDRRRAVLQQARVYREQSAAEQRIELNDLMLEAVNTYWHWAQTFQQLQVITRIIDVNTERYKLVKLGFRQGDRPAIDTVEALAQLQSFQYMQNQAKIDYLNAGLALSNYLWLSNDSAYDLPGNVLPDTIPLTEQLPPASFNADSIVSQALPAHPVLQSYGFKLQWLGIDKKYKFQSMLPYVNLKANLLNKGYNAFKEINNAFLQNNHAIGLNIVVPLRISEGRGNYQKATIKLRNTELEYSNKTREVENKIRMNVNKLAGYSEQVSIYQAAFRNYETLLRGEDTRFRIGESSLFILNSRENKVLETKQKLIELRTSYLKSIAAVDWAAGRLF